jgi:hypothetical protein
MSDHIEVLVGLPKRPRNVRYRRLGCVNVCLIYFLVSADFACNTGYGISLTVSVHPPIRSVVPIDRYFADRFDEIRKRFRTGRINQYLME